MTDHAVTRDQTTTEPVVVHGSDAHVERAHFELPLAEARSRYGGLDVPAVLGGALAGLLAGLLLALLLAALGAAGASTAAEGGLPVSLDSDRLTSAAVVAAVLGLVTAPVCGLLVGTRPGAVASPSGVVR